ncbi:MAG: HEPN domain-containing protein [Chromatiales bacterium]|jgi:hypothetical protein
MKSKALETFEHALQDSTDLLKHFDALNTQPPPPDIEVLKRASLVMALAALETYFEDRIQEAVEEICEKSESNGVLEKFILDSIQTDLKFFHSPSTDRVKQIFQKYLDVDITDGWEWNNCDPARAKSELNRLVRKRGDIAHRSLRPTVKGAPPQQHAVTRDSMRKHVHFITQLANASDAYLASKIQAHPADLHFVPAG